MANWQKLTSQFSEFGWELIVVNDGSKHLIVDQTSSKLFSQKNVYWVNNEINKGKGHALRSGLEKATGDYLIYTDIDFPYLIDSTSEVLKELLTNEYDIVAAVKDNKYYSKVPPVRRKISKTLRFFIRNFLSLKIDDTQCGLKAFNKKGKDLFLSTQIDRYLFDLEFIYLASRDNDFKLKAIPSTLREGVVFSKLNPKILLHEGRNFLSILWRR